MAFSPAFDDEVIKIASWAIRQQDDAATSSLRPILSAVLCGELAYIVEVVIRENEQLLDSGNDRESTQG
jgi:hypothetical protein